MEIVIIEGAITLILLIMIKIIIRPIYIAPFDLLQKLPIYFFMKFAVWRVIRIREQSSFLNVVYHSALEIKVKFD